jgi:uncharacterized protein (DUF433 family)
LVRDVALAASGLLSRRIGGASVFPPQPEGVWDIPVRWAERIVVDPEIHHGEPCIRGTRIPVAVVLGSLAEGLTPEAILHEYPALNAEDIQACLAYAAEVIRSGEFLAPLGV